MRFFEVVEFLSDDLLRTIDAPFGRLQNNHTLRILTWIFAACPARIQRQVIAAFKAILAGKQHPLLAPLGSKTVVIHGLGRIVTDKEAIRDLLPLLREQLPATNMLAPLSSMLSRPEATPEALAALDPERFATQMQEVLRTQHRAGTFGTPYKYTLMIIAGLLRVREQTPWALTTLDSRPAQNLAAELQNAVTRLKFLPKI